MIRRTILTIAILCTIGAHTFGAANPASAQLSRPEEVVDVLVPQLNAFYQAWLGADYHSPSTIYWYNTAENPGAIQSACGKLAVNNSFYCAKDEAIYLDYTFLWNAMSTGDYAPGFVLAHEWAHHIQHIYGILGHVRSIESELQADCLSGVFSRYIDGTVLEPGDLSEAYTEVWGLGDEPGTDPNGKTSHGEPEVRAAWFVQGYNNYDWTSCVTYQQ